MIQGNLPLHPPPTVTTEERGVCRDHWRHVGHQPTAADKGSVEVNGIACAESIFLHAHPRKSPVGHSMVQRPRQGNPTPPAILGWRERDIGERYTTIKKSGSHVTGHGRIIIIRRPPTITNLDTTSDIVEWEANTMQVTEITGGTYAAAYQYWKLHYGPYIRDLRDAIATMWRWMANTYLPWKSHWDIVSGRLINLKKRPGLYQC